MINLTESVCEVLVGTSQRDVYAGMYGWAVEQKYTAFAVLG
jgi:hypothetical protein